MKVNEIMTTNVSVVSPLASIQEAALRMRTLDTGFLPVCDGDRIQGSVTDRDIVVSAIADGMDPRKTTVQEVMSEGIVAVFEDQDVSDAAELMEENQIRRLVVLNREKKLVGVVSLGDLYVYSDDGNLGEEVLERVAQPEDQILPH